MLQKILLKFEDLVYKVEMPTDDKFTGQVGLVFHFKEGQLMKGEVQKFSSAVITENNLSTCIEASNAI